MSVYKCGKCGKLVREPRVRVACPHCSYTILYKVEHLPSKLSGLERGILHHIGDNEPVTRRDLDEAIDGSASDTQHALDALRELGLIAATRGRGHELTRSGRTAVRPATTSKRVRSWKPGIFPGMLSSAHGSSGVRHERGEEGR